MLDLAISLSLIVLCTHLLGGVGKARVTDSVRHGTDGSGSGLMTLWQLSSLALSLSPSPLSRKHRELKRDVLATRDELRKTSSQDEFAKWARLRRKLDKQTADLEKLGESCRREREGSTPTAKTCRCRDPDAQELLLRRYQVSSLDHRHPRPIRLHLVPQVVRRPIPSAKLVRPCHLLAFLPFCARR
jgi:hypothetical protein